MKKKKNYSSLTELIPYFKPYKKDIALALIALGVTALTILFFGRVVKYIIDNGFVGSNGVSLNIALLTFVVAIIVMAVAGYYRSSIVNSICERAFTDLRKKVYAYVINLSPQFFENIKTGDVASRLTADVSALNNVISNSFVFFLRNFTLFIGALIFLFFTNLKLTLIALGLIWIAIAPIFIVGKKVKTLSKKAQEAIAGVNSQIEESFSGIKTIQAYLCEKKEIKNFDNLEKLALKDSLKKIHLRSLLIAITIALSFGCIAVVLWIGGHDVLNGKLSAGELSSFIFYSIVAATALASISQISGQMQTASSSADRIFEILKTPSIVKEAKLLQNLDSKEITIKFDDVSFSYPSRLDGEILQNFSLTIKPNQKIAIVGVSGSGKSTIFQLLLRFYDVSKGAILLNDIDIKNISFKDLRKNFAYIAQDAFIFSGSIFDNIAYLDNEVDFALVQKIIDKNEALHFINNLPEGMNSYVGQKGSKLSGGERQRIAIARAIIKDSPILLLDEATSALDNNNEKIIIDAIDQLSKNKTVITIAHRYSTIMNADKIIFIKEGKIAEQGTHAELMEKNGDYKKMYHRLLD